MNEQPCRFETAVVEAARTGVWSDDLRAHVCKCPQCTESEKITSWMGTVASIGASDALPDPMLIWLKAELAKREQAAARACRFTAFVSAAPAIVLTLLASLAVFWAWSSAAGFTGAARDWFWSSLVASAPGGIATAVTLGIAILLMVVAAYLFAYRPMRNVDA